MVRSSVHLGPLVGFKSFNIHSKKNLVFKPYED